MTDDQIFETVRDVVTASGLINGHDVSRVHRFSFFRDGAAGGTANVTLDVLDHGAGSPNRWAIHAHDEDMRQASGNPDRDLRQALLVVHWQKLDQPPDGMAT